MAKQGEQKEEIGITASKEKDFSEWYIQVIQKAGIIEKRIPDSKGFYGYPSWGALILRKIERIFEDELEKTGHLPVRSPIPIPETLLGLEEKHAGFIAEVWKITHGRGNQKLEIPKLLRPTGESILYPMYKFWVRSYKDLPLKKYETTPSFRAEPDKAIFPLLRSHQFYWIEAHDVQKSNEEADKQVREDMEIFEKVMEKLAIPFCLFKRPEWDKFQGADYSCAYDAPLPDHNVLQICTTHNLGQNFSKPFEIKFKDNDGKEKNAYQTCFGPGVSRIVGALVSIHGDDKGLVLPPAIAPIQVVIVPISISSDIEKAKLKKIKEILEKEGIVVKLDDREEYTPGWKFHEWEMLGVPVRIEIGPKEIKEKKLTIARRDGGKKIISEENAAKEISKIFEDMTKNIYSKAKIFLTIDPAKNLREIEEKQKKGACILEIPFCDKENCIEQLKERNTKVRGILLFQNKEKSVEECEENAIKKAKGKECAVCGKAASRIVFIAKQY